MKVGSGYTPPVQSQQRLQAAQLAETKADRSSAEARLRDLIAQKHSEFDSFRPVEELGKHLDLRA